MKRITNSLGMLAVVALAALTQMSFGATSASAQSGSRDPAYNGAPQSGYPSQDSQRNFTRHGQRDERWNRGDSQRGRDAWNQGDRSNHGNRDQQGQGSQWRDRDERSWRGSQNRGADHGGRGNWNRRQPQRGPRDGRGRHN